MQIRQSKAREISWAEIKAMAENQEAEDYLNPFDEIDITLENGETATVVVAQIITTTWDQPDTIRFVFKDCLDEEHRMNRKLTNAGGWPACECRTYLRDTILPNLPADLQAVIKPRTITCVVDGETVTCEDCLWLCSETEVFGIGNESWNNGAGDGHDETQMPIFMTERNRVKMRKGCGTWPWFLRSQRATNAAYFCLVNTNGGASSNNANVSYGVAPGFDI